MGFLGMFTSLHITSQLVKCREINEKKSGNWKAARAKYKNQKGVGKKGGFRCTLKLCCAC
jgi:hypothetical protein